MAKEFVIWGTPPGETEETIVVSEAAGLKSRAEAERAVKYLERKFGVTGLRIAEYDLADEADFTGMVNAFKRPTK